MIANYERPCCAKFKRAASDLSRRIGGVPESLDRTMVRAGMESVKPRVVSCGEASGTKGTVRIAVEVTADGAVTAADVKDAPDEALGACVARAIRTAKFGKSVNGGSFTYPFVF